MTRCAALVTPLALAALAGGCASAPDARSPAGERPAGFVIAAGERLPVDVPVVTFLDAGGFDARREHRWFTPDEALPERPADGCDTPRRWSARQDGPPPRTLDDLRRRVSQLVVHYDAAVTSSSCFHVLHDVRGLSSHFLLDVDGRVYQTLDLADRARHAGVCNDVSIGIEIAHPGAWPTRSEADRFHADDGARLAIPPSLDPPRGAPFTTARAGWFSDELNGQQVFQRDFTERQYASLERLVASLRRSFPGLHGGPPRDAGGGVRRDALPDDAVTTARGLVGHVHVSAAKVDPGPAFDWERIAVGGE